jgi:hypothetical protein
MSFGIGAYSNVWIPDAGNCASDGGTGKLFQDDIAEFGYTSTAASDSLKYITKADEAFNLSTDNAHNSHAIADVNENLSFGDKVRSYFNNRFGDRSGLNPNHIQRTNNEWIA